MRSRPPLACAAGVLAVHVALLVALSHHGQSGSAAPSPLTKGFGAHLVLLDAARVAALSVSGVPDAGVPDTGVAAAPPAFAKASAPTASAPPPVDARASGVAAGAASPATAAAAGIGIYRPPSALDAPVRPRSAPDISILAGTPWSGLPLRVRLFIDAKGTVVDVQMPQSAEQEELLQRVRQMFLATGFTAGTENGTPVPCYKDIELTISKPS